ncbi:MAG: polysaccharide biosynthesis/export family protein [Paracoccaceae bacterium]|nr:MAG: polysaccharide biosynthesis/export family protein [Paracoccaceae bacterium]
MMPVITRRRFAAIVGATLVSGCSLPRGAAQGRRILATATEEQTASEYAIYPVTRDLVGRVAHWPMTGGGPSGSWISGGGGRSARTIRAGDKLDLVVWDSSETSLLAPSGTKAVPLAQLTVASDGKIFVPYLDRVTVAGMTAENARQSIQEQLTAIAPSAQVQLSLSVGRANSVDVVGGVGSPGSYPLEDGALTVLGLIALAGGVSGGLEHPLVRLVRGGKTYVTTVKRLYENPDLDTVLQGGDKLIIDSDSRQFIALGAAGREQILRFPNDRPTALEAMAAVGGVNDARADPQAVLILREYHASAVRDGVRGPEATRVIFVIDLTTADGLFSAGRFIVNPNDVIYVSESPLTALQSVTQVVGAVFGAGNQINNATGN